MSDGQKTSIPSPGAHVLLLAVSLAPLALPVHANALIILTASLTVWVGSCRSIKPEPPSESMSKKVSPRLDDRVTGILIPHGGSEHAAHKLHHSVRISSMTGDVQGVVGYPNAGVHIAADQQFRREGDQAYYSYILGMAQDSLCIAGGLMAQDTSMMKGADKRC